MARPLAIALLTTMAACGAQLGDPIINNEQPDAASPDAAVVEPERQGVRSCAKRRRASRSRKRHAGRGRAADSTLLELWEHAVTRAEPATSGPPKRGPPPPLTP